MGVEDSWLAMTEPKSDVLPKILIAVAAEYSELEAEMTPLKICATL